MKIIQFIASCLLILSPFNFAYAAEDLTVKQWQEDIDFYAQQLEKNHLNLYHTISKQQFVHEINMLKSQLKQLTDNQVLVALMGLTKKINDGHSSFPLWGPTVHKFPFKLVAINNKFYVIETVVENQALLGAELIAINGVAISKVATKMKDVVPFSENQYSSAVRVGQYLMIAEVLNGLGVISLDYQSQFTFKQAGKVKKYGFKAIKQPQLLATLSLEHAVSQIKVDSVSDGLWFSSSTDNKAIYLKFARYTDVDTMEKFSRSLLTFINNNQSTKLIIDLRNNYGGDFFAGLKLAQYLVLADSLDWQSGIFVLINNVTFSAAMSNTAQFKQLLNAKLVGEATGAKPKGYQDMGEFTLPNSQRVVTYSKRFYNFLAVEDNAIYPDVYIHLSIGDYLANQDKQLQWVLNQVNWL